MSCNGFGSFHGYSQIRRLAAHLLLYLESRRADRCRSSHRSFNALLVQEVDHVHQICTIEGISLQIYLLEGLHLSQVSVIQLGKTNIVETKHSQILQHRQFVHLKIRWKQIVHREIQQCQGRQVRQMIVIEVEGTNVSQQQVLQLIQSIKHSQIDHTFLRQQLISTQIQNGHILTISRNVRNILQPVRLQMDRLDRRTS
uniref:(northern house mosquito) hypothetical protein n=1 Tax=Culex pipiens TaxID=7175 RepID=A0A8D8JE14_CULPI